MSTFLLPISLAEELQKMLNSFWWGSHKDGRRSLHWMRWDNLSLKKDAGGLSYRDFHRFNLAMLGKQGWRLITRPDALVCKLLKAKYFPKGEFLNAKLGQNPSYTWRSIWSSHILLERGLRWRIGDGSHIKIWDSPWLRDPHNFYIQTPVVPALANLIVKDLFIPGAFEWDVELLQEFFLQRDVEQIINIPLSYANLEDRLLWHFTKNGIYSVKSGYNLAMDIFPLDSTRVPGNWRDIWNLDVPLKIKLFLWRVGRDCLPTKVNLCSKGVVVPQLCLFCEAGIENLWHVLVSCVYAQQCWCEANILNVVNHVAFETDSISDWLFKMLTILNGFKLGKFALVAWKLWQQRNSQLWDNNHLPPANMVHYALDFFYNWLSARHINSPQMGSLQQGQQCLLWHTPPFSFLKCNIDAALFGQDNLCGFGMVLRDDIGGFLACRSCTINGTFKVVEAEAIGLREALSWIHSLGFQNVIFEMDAKFVVDALQSSNTDLTEFGQILTSCNIMLNQVSGFQVRFVKRQANTVAHVIAKSSHLYASPMCWVEPPAHVTPLLMNICTDLSH